MVTSIGWLRHTCVHTHTHTLGFNGHFSGELGLASCPLKSPLRFIPELHILLRQA